MSPSWESAFVFKAVHVMLPARVKKKKKKKRVKLWTRTVLASYGITTVRKNQPVWSRQCMICCLLPFHINLRKKQQKKCACIKSCCCDAKIPFFSRKQCMMGCLLQCLSHIKNTLTMPLDPKFCPCIKCCLLLQ